jgi:hypothetical protein
VTILATRSYPHNFYRSTRVSAPAADRGQIISSTRIESLSRQGADFVITKLPCPGPTVNIAATSGFYAQMTGLLAGFAFTAIVVLLTPTQNLERKIIENRSSRTLGDGKVLTRAEIRANDNGLMLALLAAFFALVIATLTYSLLAGETLPQARGRAATEELVDGVPFGLAVMMLFHGVTVLMDNGNVSQVAVWLSRAVAVGVVPMLTLYYITAGATDTESARLALRKSPAVCSGSVAMPTLGVNLTCVLVVILIASLVTGRRIARIRVAMRRLQVVPPVIVVVFSIGTAVLAGSISTRSDRFLMSPSILNRYLILTFAALAVIAAILAIGGGRDQAIGGGRDQAIAENEVSAGELTSPPVEQESALSVGNLITEYRPILKAGVALALGAIGGIAFKAVSRRQQ